MRRNLQGKKRICPICGKLHTFISSEGLCEKHYYQRLRYGKFLDTSARSIYDPNEFIIDGDITYIKCYDKRGRELPLKVIIDTKNIDKVLKYKIYLRYIKKDNLWYAVANVCRNNKVRVHQLICPTEETVDHINGNTLDNRECNLRPANFTIQNLNKRTSKGIQKQVYTYKGKYIVKGYAATMGYKGKRYISRYYKTEEEAMYYRYLLLQLLPFKTNYDTSFLNKLTPEQKENINKDFINRFKDRVL